MTTVDQSLSPIAACLRIAAQRGRQLRLEREAEAREPQQTDQGDDDDKRAGEAQREGANDDAA